MEAEGEHPIGLASGGLYESRSRHGGGKRGEELSWQRIGEPPGDGHRHLPFVFDKCRWPKKPEGAVALTLDEIDANMICSCCRPYPRMLYASILPLHDW